MPHNAFHLQSSWQILVNTGNTCHGRVSISSHLAPGCQEAEKAADGRGQDEHKDMDPRCLVTGFFPVPPFPGTRSTPSIQGHHFKQERNGAYPEVHALLCKLSSCHVETVSLFLSSFFTASPVGKFKAEEKSKLTSQMEVIL